MPGNKNDLENAFAVWLAHEGKPFSGMNGNIGFTGHANGGLTLLGYRQKSPSKSTG